MSREDDAVAIAPEMTKVISNSHGVRVLEVKFKPGDLAKMHWHPESVSYIITGGKLKITMPGGTSMEAELTPGQVMNSGEVHHSVENVGDTEVQMLQIEFMN